MRYNAPGSIRSVSKKYVSRPDRVKDVDGRKLRTVKSIFDLNADID
jgi:hypothetical protein